MLGIGYNLLSEDACLNIAVLLEKRELEKIVVKGNTIGEEAHSRIVSLLPGTMVIR
jgi:Ran GTPase-activating protein (RanGAP) involved in mRNA processing and transport